MQLSSSSSGCVAVAFVCPRRRWRRRRHGEAGMGRPGGRTMPPFPPPPIVHRSEHCSGPPRGPRATHTRPAGTEMAAPLTRSTIPPPVCATMGGHAHRHLYGTRGRGGAAGASRAGAAAASGPGTWRGWQPESFLLFRIHIVRSGLQRMSVCVLGESGGA